MSRNIRVLKPEHLKTLGIIVREFAKHAEKVPTTTKVIHVDFKGLNCKPK